MYTFVSNVSFGSELRYLLVIDVDILFYIELSLNRFKGTQKRKDVILIEEIRRVNRSSQSIHLDQAIYYYSNE